ncbi:MAG: ATP-binding cassette domain-containing protein [Anaerolineae bacterium]|nr:ATP-binding cassette domain-containing protein [Anaerolineae bacterium]
MASIRVEDVTFVFEARDPLRSVFRDRRAPAGEPGEEPEGEAEGKVRALDRCTLDVADGETIAIVGPSGCGKSTLLRVVAGLLSPQEGRVLYDGQDMADVAPKDRGIGMVFQNYALYPHWESQENLGFFFRLRKREREIPERVRITSEIMGIGFERLLSRKPPTLSGGEQQRVAIARCIVRDPRLFLFDEPLSNLDAKLRAQTRVEIKRLLRRFAITSLYVTHDQTEAMALGDRIAVMRKGRVDQVGTYADLYSRPANAYVAGFLGSPPINLFPAEVSGRELRAQGLVLPVPSRWSASLAAGQRVLVGIRAEDLRYDAASSLRLQVDLVEPIYSQRVQLVYFLLGERRLVAQLPEQMRLQPGDPLPLAFAEEALHLFDAETELRLPEA